MLPMNHLMVRCVIALGLSCAGSTQAAERSEVGNRIADGLPELSPELASRLARYQNTRGAAFAGWQADGSMLITTRFGETNQVHRVRQPLGMREQITFYAEPTTSVAAQPIAGGNGFVFAKDEGGSEFWQLYHYDFAHRQPVLISPPGRSRNEYPLWSHDGKTVAFTSTARNGKDSDIWIRPLNGEPRAVLTEGGTWYASDFSPDGKKLLVSRYVSINESYPGELDLATGAVEMFPVEGGKAAFGQFRYAPGGDAAYYISDENSEFKRLQLHASNRTQPEVLSGNVHWDITQFDIADDAKHLAYVANEGGISRLHVVTIPEHRPVTLPQLPIGVIGSLGFSPDSKRIAVTLNSATSPSDVLVIDLEGKSLSRWTEGEVGGLDAQMFVAPQLIEFPSFDGLKIPAFLYQPAGLAAADNKRPVVILIHGGPEAQSLPVFNPSIQFMVNELGMAVVVPNVRGSAGYGKTWLSLDNGFRRKDSVKDIGALLDWIAGQPGLDAKRVGVMGGSYGGYMVLAALVDYPDRITAGIDIVGISHFTTFLEATESYRRDLRRAEYGDERDPEMRAFFERIAPLNNANKITSPLFVAQGTNDPRVPISEAEQIVRAVREQDGEVWYLAFKDEGHGFAKKANSDYFGTAAMQFWQTHLLRGSQR